MFDTLFILYLSLPFLIIDIKMHYTNLNGCNLGMLWNIDLSLILF